MSAMVEMVILELDLLGAEASRRPLAVENGSKENEEDQTPGIPKI